MEPVLAVEPVIISPWLTPSKSPCHVLSDVNRVMSFVFSKSVGSPGVILMSKEPVAWTPCMSFWAATLSARLITAAAAATANLTLIKPPKCKTYRTLNPNSHRLPPVRKPGPDTLILPQHPNHPPLHFHRCRWHDDRLHGHIRRLQPDVLALTVKAFQRGIAGIDQRDDNVAVVRSLGFLHEHVIAVKDVFILHGFPTHLKHEHVLRAHEIRQRNGLRILHRFNRLTCGDASQQGQHQAGIHAHGLLQPSLGRHQIDGAAAVIVAREQALLLQIRDVLVHGGQRIQVEPLANLLKRRRIAMLGHESRNKVVNFVLPACDRHAAIIGEQKAKKQARSVWLRFYFVYLSVLRGSRPYE